MTAKSSFYFEDDKLWVEMETWTDLIGEKSAVPIHSLKAAAADIIQRGGAFIVNDINIGIMNRCDRIAELEALMRDVDDARRRMGLQAL